MMVKVVWNLLHGSSTTSEDLSRGPPLTILSLICPALLGRDFLDHLGVCATGQSQQPFIYLLKEAFLENKKKLVSADELPLYRIKTSPWHRRIRACTLQRWLHLAFITLLLLVQHPHANQFLALCSLSLLQTHTCYLCLSNTTNN